MGNVLSSAQTGTRNTNNTESESEIISNMDIKIEKEANDNQEVENEEEERIKAKEQDMEEFRKQLEIKREQRKDILARHRSEKEALEKSLQSEKASKLELYESNKELRELLIKNNIEIPDNLGACRENTELTDAIVHITEEFEQLKANNNKLRRDLTESNCALQNAYSDIAELNAQNTESIKQIHALKEVITVSKTMINLREDQLNELKNKLHDIEQTLADRETSLLSTDLRQEYERQLHNIRTLRGLYEERARLAEVTRQGLARELEQQKILHQTELNKSKSLTEKVEELESKVDALHEIIENKNNQIATCQDETNGLKAEMAVVNKLFSQVLLGYKTKQDLDMLVHRLEENHGILTHMAERENDAEASSALPKLLLEIVSQVDEQEENKDVVRENENNIEEVERKTDTNDKESENLPSPTNTTPEEIVENLPKVWRVLMELLSHQTVAESNPSDKVTTCYKSVETKSGPVLVPSVSQTYIRLKDLIVEKLGLMKEVNRMKQLNAHLESRLGEQEKRLCLVTSELSKTWHVVGRLRRHHHQLHTHEKILKYELQQKRKLLNELKEELEYCREKWEQAREKNTQSEKDWKKLRADFSSRKTKVGSPSLNNSAESGYSDERPSDDSSESNDESEYVAESLIRYKKKLKKSFETILDSSTDYNQAAEREDPASDMLDVADLPLDTQDGDDNQEVADLSKSDNVPKHNKLSEETEDEIGDIAHDDSCAEDISTEIKEINQNSIMQANFTVDTTDSSQNVASKSNLTTDTEQAIVKIDPAEILKNVRLQNERLARKDAKMESLEKISSALLKKTQATVKISHEIDSTLDHLINRPTSSHDRRNESVTLNISKLFPGLDNCQTQNKDCQMDDILTQKNESENHNSYLNIASASNAVETVLSLKVQAKSNINVEDTRTADTDINENNPQTSSLDLKSNAENSQQQSDEITKKNKRPENIEETCTSIDTSKSNTVESGAELIKKFETANEKCTNSEKTISDTSSNEESQDVNEKNNGPSTSGEIDHEARFAARDLRLKMLEEQTKSLVNKVNKTTTKGVKIHYKLEELHNIYGSEHSRASTPSEDNNDKSSEEEPRSE